MESSIYLKLVQHTNECTSEGACLVQQLRSISQNVLDEVAVI